MSAGTKFLQKCLDTRVELDPWPHQILENTLDDAVFEKLKTVSNTKLAHIMTDNLIHIHPAQYEDYGIDFYDETLDICDHLYSNIKNITGKYPECRHFDNLGVNAHISITPPLPYKFYIHDEGLEKIWSSVTYISPTENVGTKMYTAQHEDAFVKEAEWIPNSTFIFCGKQRKTWHSYESTQNTNRITFNLFIMKYRSKKCFFPL